MELTLEGKKRPEGSKPKALRRAGLIPANLYGHEGTQSIHLTLEAKTVEILLKKVSVNNTLINLNVTDIPWRGKTLLREVQAHPAKGYPYHLSFFAVAADESVDVEVPLHYVGDAVGVKQEGGLLDPVITQLQVRCAAGSIPDAIEVNVSNMHVGDSVYIHELVLPSGVTILSESEQAVVTVLPQQINVDTDAAVETESESAAG